MNRIFSIWESIVVLLAFVISARAGAATHSPSRPVNKIETVCRAENFAGKKFQVCRFDSATDDIRLMWKNPDGEPYGSIPAVLNGLAREGKTLVLAMAGGMFHSDSTPVGLYIEHGHEFRAINTDNGPGNFFYKPNGVVYFGKKGAGILETGAYIKAKLLPEFAVQAGPLLVKNGELHPRALESSDPVKKPRSGVGVDREGHLMFVFSDDVVTFHELATFFRDQLGCANALHLDSTSVSVFAPSLARAQKWTPIGPILGVVRKVK